MANAVTIYLMVLLGSTLPVSRWLLVGAWPVLYVVNHLVASRLRAYSLQTNVVVENREAISRASQPLWMFIQVLYAAGIFTFALYAGGPIYTFLAGGADVCVICILALNVQALLSAQALKEANFASGTMTLSAAYALHQMAARLFGAALTCGLLGVMLAQLALFGGAVLCGAAGAGYLRRARALKSAG